MRTAAALACAGLGLLAGLPCQASLGGDLASVQADQQAWGASSSQSTLAAAVLHTQTLSNGVTVRQYVNAQGMVFAVAWDGPVLPDFKRLLGAHYTAYNDGVHQQKHGVNVHSAALVVESGGMMRAFSGRAWLPAQLPAAWTAQDIR